MSDARPVALHFDPGTAREQIPLFLPSCSDVQKGDADRGLVLVFRRDILLSGQELGRLLLIHGKCQYHGIPLSLRCSKPVAEQLSRLHIDRLIFLEKING